jgi:hypothetical protein
MAHTRASACTHARQYITMLSNCQRGEGGGEGAPGEEVDTGNEVVERADAFKVGVEVDPAEAVERFQPAAGKV